MMLENKMAVSPEDPPAPRILEDLTVVIPTLGRPILEECLDWIAAGSAVPAEVIVVDQGSNPKAASWVGQLRELGIVPRYTPSRQRGRSAGINRGLEQVRTRFVAVTDDDCLVERLWAEAMVSHLRRTPEQIVTGRVEPAGEGDVAFCVVTSLTPTVYYRPVVKAHPLIGGNMAASMEIVRRVGPFDEHPCVSSAEDSDWGYRALRLGIPIAYAPDVVVRHFSWRNSDERARRYLQYSKSQGGFYGKHLLSGDPVVPLQALRGLVRGPVRWLRGAMKGDQDMIDRGRADTLGLIPGIIAGLRRGRTP